MLAGNKKVARSHSKLFHNFALTGSPNSGHTARLRSPKSLASLGTSHVRKPLSEITRPFLGG